MPVRYLGYCLLFLLIFTTSAMASSIDLKEFNKGELVNLYTHYLIDKTANITFDQLPELSDSAWQQSDTEISSFGYTSDAIWIQFDITNSSAESDWFIDIAYPLLDYVDVYIQRADELHTYQLGERKPFSDRPTNHRNFILPIKLSQNTSARVTLRASSESSLQIPIIIWSQTAFDDYLQMNSLGQGIYFGLMLVMIIYNLFLYSYIREIRYIQYVGLVSSFVLFHLSISGFGYQFLWPAVPKWNEYSIPIFLGMLLTFECLFVRDFLELKKHMPKTARFLTSVAALGIILSLLSIFISYRIAIVVLISLAIPINIFCLGVGIRQSLNGYKVARLFTLAWASSMVAAILLAFNKLGLIERNILTEHGLQIGTAIEVVLLSFALGEYISQQRIERQKAKDDADKYSLKVTQERYKREVAVTQNAEVTKALDLAEQRSQDVSDLLNNSGQGFIAFGEDTIVTDNFSQACLKFFNLSPSGKHAADLLYDEGDQAGRALFAQCIESALQETDTFRRDMMMSLLPSQYDINGFFLKAEFKPLESARIMVVLTNISNEITLQNKIENEHSRLSMILAAVTEQAEVYEIVSEFNIFISHCENNKNHYEPAELYRKIHTFKGLFNQFAFCKLPEALHRIENEISQKEILTRFDMKDLEDALDADLDVINIALEGNFNIKNRFTQVSKDVLDDINALVSKLKSTQYNKLKREDFEQLLTTLDKVLRVDFKQLLNPLIRGAYSLADSQGKKLHISLDGDDLLVHRDTYKDFINSLVHVFRNAIDHGIELPEDRGEQDKDEVGNIKCSMSVDGNDLVIQVKDDGGGIDPEKIRQRLQDQKTFTAIELNSMSDKQLLQTTMADGVSTKDNITEISGRGLGMAATNIEVEKLGGKVEISSALGEWTMVDIRIPWVQNNEENLRAY